MRRVVYLDYNATTPLDPRVRAAMEPFLSSIYGNPSSVHALGRNARAALDSARDQTAELWRCKPSEVVFTSGGTESSNLAVLGMARAMRHKGRHLVVSSIEHHAVLYPARHLAKHEGFELTEIPVDAAGRVDPDTVAASVRPDTVLVSVMSANNEVGTLQAVNVIGEQCRAKNILFHTDAVQSFGKEPFSSIHQFNADLVSICAHKFHGPRGAGALFIRSPHRPAPLMLGGAQENEQRPGTENLAAIIGFVEAMGLFLRQPPMGGDSIRCLRDRLRTACRAIPGVNVITPSTGVLDNTLALAVEGTDSLAVLAGLDLEGVCASSGSACSSGSLEPSHVLAAMGIPAEGSRSLVRFSLGAVTTDADVDHVIRTLPKVIQTARAGDRC